MTLTPTSPQGIAVSPTPAIQRTYPGTLLVQAAPHPTLRVINRVAAQDYVTAVVASETPLGWPSEALKAQAVLTQTRLLSGSSDRVRVDSTQEELYRGRMNSRPEVITAVQAVYGQTLRFQNRPITVFYHSTCAEHTTDSTFFGGGKGQPLPYLRAVPCAFCRPSPFWKITERRLPKAAFERHFGPGLPKVLRLDATQRPWQVETGDGRRWIGEAFWRELGHMFGWDKAPGSRVHWARLPNGDIAIRSTGAGHGVGLCQWGAAGMARAGRSYEAILHYYFPGTRLAL